MKCLLVISLLVIASAVGGTVFAQQRRERFAPYDQSTEKAEFGWSRLRYSSSYGDSFGFRGGNWSRDYPKADRQFLEAFSRLTRINARPTEQVVDLDTDDIYNWPFVYAVQVETWTFTPAQAQRMRDYLLRGGFLMVD